jgi:AhpD family alkylhydroperoxidase
MKQRMAAGKLAPQAYKAVADLDRRVSESGIDGALYLLLKIRASQINGCAFCIDLHTREARERGEPKGRIRALDAWAEAKGVFGERMLANVLMAALAINAWNRIAVADPHGAEARHPVMGEGFASLQLEEVWIRFRVGLSTRRRGNLGF